jgi:Holliday junction resolvase RusA-like endonuclease
MKRSHIELGALLRGKHLIIEAPVTVSLYSITLEGQPTAWKRPAQMRGSSARFDSQAEQKNTDSIAAFRQILQQMQDAGIQRSARSPLFPTGNPVGITFRFFFMQPPKPASDFPTKCDLDNLIKYYNDMLQSNYMKGVLWEDDRQISRINAEKLWCKHSSRTEIIIMPAYTQT